MKKLTAVILSALMLLTSCGSAVKYSEGYETARRCTSYDNINMNGMFFTDTYDGPEYMAQRLWFFDFESMKSAIMCARPNCQHNDHDTCTSFGIYNHPTIAEGKLYYFEHNSEWVSDTEAKISLNVWRAEIDGGSRVKIDTIDDIEINDMMVKGSTVYFTARGYSVEMDYEAMRQTNSAVKYSICSYDLVNKVFTNYGTVAEGYNGGMDFIGEYNGGFYVRYSYTEEEVDIYESGFVLKDNWSELLREAVITGFCRLDIETGEILPCDMPISTLNEYGNTKPMFASGGFYGYMDGDNAVIVDSEGSEMVIDNYELPDIAIKPINGYIFNVDDGTAIDLSSGEIVKLNMSAIPKYGYVLHYLDGSYIIYSQFLGDNFKKVSEDEIFKE